ncbi:hypothetical protein FT663_04641 [Candidozyma haemuli var. vulneris]|uniref:Phosphoribulokinase/uridine kinase domain-containing protein n=1 Tax=Candidozyma haemuli TaxID=45357 RepID=A0A2V1AZ52_9ASCO|nr:hypothetical protein CXQ85_002811 [[Candida] haemuloni]KAF3986993.1 hypothetical protein FT663_04641 [[Candida] haemuloni var. vulneris]KAF3991014.1 hypothetical protein FT662_01950 [[Candida] haemuloni var. vulneris]PVH23084.1 hypothetical protein CXQ85_002811 [[Candida] haemuloni]
MSHYESSQLAQLQQRVQALLENKDRVIVAVAGVPGAGKSTLVERMVEVLTSCGVETRVLPQDGYHFYREQLARFDNPDEAFRRRGAPFTFDGARFVASVKRVKAGETVWAPSFDHAKKDPVENDICIEPSAKVVFVEGNYVGLKDEPWSELASVVDELWVVQTAPEIVRERIVQRHLKAGIAKNLEEAAERADGSDWQNALYVMGHTREANATVSMDN